MNSLSLIFAVHNHQPSGNFESVMEDAYRLSYLPFLEVLERHPAIAFTQHWTGTLLEWIVRRHPECVELMRAMVQRRQLEILSGGYYEPILAVIPEADRLGQIRKLTDLIQTVFDVAPRGAWLAERVWEPHLAGSLARAGMEFVVVDDTHFRHAGLVDDQLYGYYVTEELGETLKVFPIDKTLRYTVPFRPEPETLEYLRQSATDDGMRVVVHADDGEKFGVWPKTFKHVFEDGWLERFCTMIESHADLVKTEHFGEFLDAKPAQGRIYLPTCTYAEMTKWVLSPAVALRLDTFERSLKDQGTYELNAMFVRGGYWRNFFAKYPESNHMHKKMLRVSQKVQGALVSGSTPEEILDSLWAGQCNDPYWHGLFGGLYLPNLRFPVYRSLLRAEVAIDKAGAAKPLTVEKCDFDCDGYDELIVESALADYCLKPNVGGCLVELSFKTGAVNLLDILSRREEASHRKLFEAVDSHKTDQGWDELLAKEEDIHKHIFFDWYRHASLLDHFIDEKTDLGAFARCQHKELGDFVNQVYGSTVTQSKEHVVIELSRLGAIWEGGVPHRLMVTKRITISKREAGFTADYLVSNLEASPVEARFGVEFALGGMAGDAPDRFLTIGVRPGPIVNSPLTIDNGQSRGQIPSAPSDYGQLTIVNGASGLNAGGVRPGPIVNSPLTIDNGHVSYHSAAPRLRSQGVESDVDSFKATDEWMHVASTWELSQPATLWRFPLETVSLSESGFERLYQGTIFLPWWDIKLAPKGERDSEWKVSLKQRLSHWEP